MSLKNKNLSYLLVVGQILKFTSQKIQIVGKYTNVVDVVDNIQKNEEVIRKLIKIYELIENESQKEKIIGLIKHMIVDKADYQLVSDENQLLRFIYFVNEFKDFQKISYKKDLLNFNGNNYFKRFVSKGQIYMINIKGIYVDKNNRYFIIQKELWEEFKEFTTKNYMFEVDINNSYIYSQQNKIQTSYEHEGVNLSDILDFVHDYNTCVYYNHDKNDSSLEYYEHLIIEYFDYRVHSAETLLDYLGDKINIVNDISSTVI